MYYRSVGVTRNAFALVACTAAVAFSSSAAGHSGAVDGASGPSGKIAFHSRILDRHDAYRVVVMNADGSGQVVLPLGERHSFTPAWSPDATKIAFVSDAFIATRPEIWVMNADGGGQRRLTRKGDEPAWAPDGRSIAFSRADDIYVMGSDGSGKRRLTRRGTSPTWSPDGRTIAFVRALAPGCYRRNHDKPTCQNSREIYTMNAEGTGQRRLTRNRFPEYDPDWSPTGTKLAYASVYSVFVMNADGSSQRRLPSVMPAAEPSWSPDETRIAFSSRGVYIYTMNADGTGKRRLYPGVFFPCEGCGGPDWSSR
jgi:Tol biopolymer transport system component